MYSETEASSPPLTRYPLTFYTYQVLPHDLDRVKEDKNKGFLDIAKDPEIFIPRYFSNGRLYFAHERIIHDGEHPFSAWLGVLGINYNDEKAIFHYTRLSPSQCEQLTATHHPDSINVFPDAQTVRRFCDMTGIHPAHLEPGIRDPDFSYDPHVFTVILDVYLDNTAPQADRDIAFKALASEFVRFQNMMADPRASKFEKWLKAADGRLEFLRKSDASVTVSEAFQDKFNLHDPYRVVDGLTRLNCLAAQFNEATVRCVDTLLKETTKLRVIYRELLDDASLLYGEENEEGALNKILRAIEENRKLPNGKYMPLDQAFWADMEDDIFGDLLYDVLGEVREQNFYHPAYDLPHFAIDCMDKIERENATFPEIKDSFMSKLEAYCDQKLRIERVKSTARFERADFIGLEQWLTTDAEARRVVLPLYTNICQLRDRVPGLFAVNQRQLSHSAASPS